MRGKRIPEGAFELYLGMGPDRSYEALAKRLGCTKRGILNLATREDWQGRLSRIEQKAREAADEKAIDTVEAMKTRHLRMYQSVQKKALETLKTMNLKTAMDAVRALDIAVEGERLARDEPTERTAVDIQTLIQREYDSLMLPPESDDEWGDDVDTSEAQ